MSKYLIRIETGSGTKECISINGDSLRPFQIAGNLWNYQYPGHAARRLETLAKAWENNGFAVKRIYGTILDMPKKGNDYNIGIILAEHGIGSLSEAIKKYYNFN